MTKDELESTLEMRDAELAVRDDALDALRAENARLRDLIRTAHDNADYIVSMLQSESEAVSVWPQTRHAVLLMKAEAIMALEDEMRTGLRSKMTTTWSP